MQYAISSAAFMGKKQQQKYNVALQLLAFSPISFCFGLTDSSSEKNRTFKYQFRDDESYF